LVSRTIFKIDPHVHLNRAIVAIARGELARRENKRPHAHTNQTVLRDVVPNQIRSRRGHGLNIAQEFEAGVALRKSNGFHAGFPFPPVVHHTSATRFDAPFAPGHSRTAAKRHH
jgi:hypothetical protein